MSELVPIPSAKLEAVWPAVAPWINKACERNSSGWTAHDYFEAIRKGDMDLWVGYDEKIQAVAVTEIIGRSWKVFRIDLCVGINRKDWIDLIDELETRARNSGCRRFRADTRPGWKKELARKGYINTHLVMEKDL